MTVTGVDGDWNDDGEVARMPDAEDEFASNNPYGRQNQDFWAQMSARQARQHGRDDDRTQAEAQAATGEELTEEERRWLAEEAAQQPTGEELTDEERRWLAEEAAQQPTGEELTDEERRWLAEEAALQPTGAGLTEEVAQRIMAGEVAGYRARTGQQLFDEGEQTQSVTDDPPPTYRTMAAPGQRLTDIQIAAMGAHAQYPGYAPQQGMTMPSAGDYAPWDSRTLNPNEARFAAEVAGTLRQTSALALSPADWQRAEVGQSQEYAGDTLLSPDQTASADDLDPVAAAQALGTVSFNPGPDVGMLLHDSRLFTISPSPSPSPPPSPPPVNPVARAANDSVHPSGRSASGSGTRRNPAGTPLSPVTAQGQQRRGPARGPARGGGGRG